MKIYYTDEMIAKNEPRPKISLESNMTLEVIVAVACLATITAAVFLICYALVN